MSVKRLVRWSCPAVGAVLVTAGCGVSGLYSPAAKPTTEPPVAITWHAAPSALVAVVDGTGIGPALSGLVAATAGPKEDLDILSVSPRPEALIASASPAPAKVVIPGKPVAPGKGATAYAWGLYRKSLKTWDGEFRAGERDAATRTQCLCLNLIGGGRGGGS
jgi:hypothetical protein